MKEDYDNQDIANGELLRAEVELLGREGDDLTFSVTCEVLEATLQPYRPLIFSLDTKLREMGLLI